MNQAESIRLIELYKKYPVLYNPREKRHRSKAAREAAWAEISKQMNITACYLKSKMKILMGTYRSERSRVRKKILADPEADESSWFAFKHFAFLEHKESPETTLEEIKPEESPDSGQFGINVSASISPGDSSQNNFYLIPVTPESGKGQMRQILPKKRKGDPDSVYKTPDSASKKPKPTNDVAKDPFFIYGQHIANELRKYDPGTLAYVKRAFADVLFEADVGTIVQRYNPRASEPALNFQTPENEGNENSGVSFSEFSPVAQTDCETTDGSN